MGKPGLLDLNADLGEGSGTDEEMLRIVTSASVACGAHAGSPAEMVRTARLAADAGAAVGAHPSFPDREGFGRRSLGLSGGVLTAEVACQIGAMAAAAAVAGTKVRFVKPHGALYNEAAGDAGLARAVVQAVSLAGPYPLLCPASSKLAAEGRRAGLQVYAEAFADRAYRADGTLLPRSEPGAVIEDPGAVVDQALQIAIHRRVPARGGPDVELEADSICVHGDTPGAVELARAIRRALEGAGVRLASFL